MLLLLNLWLWGKFFLQSMTGSPKWTRWSHLACLGSQSQCRIWFILPAHGVPVSKLTKKIKYQQESLRPYQYLYLKLFCSWMKFKTPSTCCLLACDQNLHVPTISDKKYLSISSLRIKTLSIMTKTGFRFFMAYTLQLNFSHIIKKLSQHLLCNCKTYS